MSELPISSSGQKGRAARLLRRILTFLVVAYCIGFVVSLSHRVLDRDKTPAGFAHGLLHGATMPVAMPNLAMGKDVTIYAVENNGLPYKLGYTMGVNACGAIFFGVFFWRVNRWKKSREKLPTAAVESIR